MSCAPEPGLPQRATHARLPKQPRSRESFDRVLEATIALLRERAYDQVTLADICRQARVSTGALYGRVQGKDALLRAVQARFFEDLGQEFDRDAERIGRQTHGLAQTVPAVVSGLGNLLRTHANILRAFMQRSKDDELLTAAGRRFHDENHPKLMALLSRCSGEIRRPDIDRAIETGMLLIYALQVRYLGLELPGDDNGDIGAWNTLLDDLGDMLLAYLRSVPRVPNTG